MNRYTITYTTTSEDDITCKGLQHAAAEAGLKVLEEIESATGYSINYDDLGVSVSKNEDAKSKEGLPYTFGETLELDIINHDTFAFSSGNFGYVEVQYISCSNNGKSTTARVHYKGLILNMCPSRLSRPGDE